jgi:lambda family phage portal protein
MSILQSIAPKWCLNRELARKQIEALNSLPSIQASSVAYPQAYQSRMDDIWSLSLSQKGLRELNRYNLRRMRDRSRQMERENVLAAAILDRCVDNVIGTGLRLLPATPDEEFNKTVLGAWDAWKDQADITGRFSFSQYQSLKYRSYLRDGDVGTVLISRGEDCYLQAISGDYIDSVDAMLDNPSNVHGMEMNNDGKITKYYIKVANENDWWDEQSVPARNMIFYARHKQLTDYRGEPLFAPIFWILEQMLKYVDAEVIKKRIEACHVLLIKKNNGLQTFQALNTTQNANQQQQATLPVEPGAIHYLKPDEDVTVGPTSNSEQNVPQFLHYLSSLLGLNCGLNVHTLLLDYTGLSYSSAKAAALQSQRHFRVQQNIFIDRVLKRLYQWWLSKQVKNGLIKVPSALTNSFWAATFVPPGFPLLDPSKEIQSIMAEIDGGLNTWSHAALSHGIDWVEMMGQRARDEDLLDKLGINLSKSTATREPASIDNPNADNSITEASDEPIQEEV